MQRYDLTIDKFLDHAAKWSGAREIVSARTGGPPTRCGYAQVRDRANRASGALLALGLTAGQRVATLAWNTQHHFELYYAAMGAGLVCHTLNPRLTPEQLAVMVNEADDRVLCVPANLAALAARLLPLCPSFAHVIWIDDDGPPPTATDTREWAYETLLSEHGAPVAWGGFDEETPAGLCYTSGTTGAPKGVIYSHRSNYLHTLRSLQADAFALAGSDSLLMAVPMFHANGWGLPFAAPAVAAKLVLPGRQLDGASLAALMRDEQVTVGVGVQTVWIGVLDHLERTGEALPDLRRVIVGGSDCPDALIQRLESGLGVSVQTTWGMTELSPLGVAAAPAGTVSGSGAGRPIMGIDLRLTNDGDVPLPDQRSGVGRLSVKGHSVIDRYFGAATDATDADGWFDTGDLASIDPDGNLFIRGRSKDLIKSGGEWINPADIEAIVGTHPDVVQVAVVARSDAKWGERPVLIIEPTAGASLNPATLIDSLRGQVADWWLPDQVIQLAAMPLASTGKIDKMRLRAGVANGDLEELRAA